MDSHDSHFQHLQYECPFSRTRTKRNKKKFLEVAVPAGWFYVQQSVIMSHLKGVNLSFYADVAISAVTAMTHLLHCRSVPRL
jgi:hypothetical protein